MRAFNRLHNFLMTFAAGLFSYFPPSLRDVNVVFKPARREVVGMPETVACFGCVLANESGRRVAIVAHGDCTMARFHPAAKLLLHDMTIHTRFSVVSHV